MADSSDTVFPFGKTDAASTATLKIIDALNTTHLLAEAAVMATDSLDDEGVRDALAELIDTIGKRVLSISEKAQALLAAKPKP